MFRHILVPLDGSMLAETALSVAQFLCRVFKSRVTLFHVIEKDAPREIHGERHLQDPLVAGEYLREQADRFSGAGIAASVHVHEDPQKSVSRSIAEHAEEFKVDLIVMCTHGSGGLRGFMFGRIAQQVVALSEKPVFFVQPSKLGEVTDFHVRRLLVPLDGNKDHEESLIVAERFAMSLGAELFLVLVVPGLADLPGEESAAARMSPAVAGAFLEIVRQDAANYLDMHVARLRRKGLSAVSAVFRGNPVSVISAVVEESSSDAIVLATHGKTGLDAFWSRSATPFLSKNIRIPFLLVPVVESRPGMGDDA